MIDAIAKSPSRDQKTADESLSLNHFLEQAHAIGEHAERTAAEAERNRRADDRAVRSLIDSGLLRILHAKRFGGYELGFPEFVRVAQALAQHDVSLRGSTALSEPTIGGEPSIAAVQDFVLDLLLRKTVSGSM